MGSTIHAPPRPRVGRRPPGPEVERHEAVLRTRWGPFEATVADPSLFHARPALAVQSGKTVMIDPRKFDDLARRIQASLPPGLDEVREDVVRNVRAIIAAGIARMDLVEREEFDVQSAVLARTREKLETLERRVRRLEEQLDEPAPASK